MIRDIALIRHALILTFSVRGSSTNGAGQLCVGRDWQTGQYSQLVDLGGHFLGKVVDLRGFSEPLPALPQGFRGEILGWKVVVQHINEIRVAEK